MTQNGAEIVGVSIKQLKTHGDNRGFFREVVRVSDPFFSGAEFGQWSHSLMQKDVVKAWHFHHRQTDWWYLPIGVIKTVLIDFREESPTYRQRMVLKMGDARVDPEAQAVCVHIPPGVLHGCRVLSDEAHLMYITSMTYDPTEEGRLPYNSSDVGFDWGPDAITAENDRKTFIPPHERKRLS